MTATTAVIRAWIVALLSLAGGLATVQAESVAGGSRIEIKAEVLPSGRVRFDESIELRSDRTAEPLLTRQLTLRGATFPLAARVFNVRVADADGTPLDFRTRAYGEWFNIDLLTVPAGGVVHLQYETANALDFRGDRVELRWSLIGRFWNLPVESLSVEVVLPQKPTPRVEVRASLDYEPYEAASAEVVDRVLRWQTSGLIEPDEMLDWTVVFPKQKVERLGAGGYLRELSIQGGIPLWAAVFLVVALPILRRLPPLRLIDFTRVWNALIVIVVLLTVLPLVWYWVRESPYRGGDAGSVVAEMVGNLGLAAFLAVYVWRQDRWITRRDQEAYSLEIALPVVLCVFVPMFTVNRAILFFPLLGLPVFAYWMRQPVALQFGAGIHRLVERVVTEGQVSFASLASVFEIDEKQLSRVLKFRSELPIVTDFENETVYAPEVAALKESFAVCAYCGGGTEAKSMALVACPYCEHEYAGSRRVKPRRPVPVIARVLARSTDTLGTSIAALFVLVAVAGIGIEIVEGGSLGSMLILALVLSSIGVGIGLLMRHWGRGILQGKCYVPTRIALLAGSPLILPLLAYRKLGTRLLQLHFGRIEPKQIAKEINERGEMRLDQLAAYLETTPADAADAARYLAGNDLIDAVFDRVNRRLVSRRLYRTLAHAGACDGCGGLLGVIGGTVTCHYCGRPSVTI